MHSILKFGVAVALRTFVFLFYVSFSFLFEAWQKVDKDSGVRHALFNLYNGVVYEVVNVAMGTYFTAWLLTLAKRLPFYGLIDLGIRDRGSVLLAIPLSFLALAMFDFFYYWMHRLQHASRWLWAEHEFHHSEEHLNATTGLRHHHLEVFLKILFINLPLAVLFRVPVVTFGIWTVLTQAFVYFIHANTPISFGPFNRILASPQIHRIHHSKLPEHLDKNFAAYFPLWDVIFGTYYHPKPGEYPPTGLASGRTVESVFDAALMPFKTWADMLRSSDTPRLSEPPPRPRAEQIRPEFR